MKMKLKPARLLLYLFAYSWAIVTLYPLLVTFMSSFKENSEIYGSMFTLPKVWNFSFYAEAVVQANMLNCVKNSLVLTSSATLVLVVLSSMGSFVLVRYNHMHCIKLLYMLFIVGIMLPIHSTLIPLAKIIGSIKGKNNYLIMILIYVAFQLPMSIFLISGYMKGIPASLAESAEMDGCTPIRLLFSIYLPVSLPGIATSAIIAFLGIYNDLIFAVMFISDAKKFTISQGMLTFVGFRNTEMGPVFASIIIAIIPMVVIYLLFQSQIQKGMLAGSVKG